MLGTDAHDAYDACVAEYPVVDDGVTDFSFFFFFVRLLFLLDALLRMDIHLFFFFHGSLFMRHTCVFYCRR